MAMGSDPLDLLDLFLDNSGGQSRFFPDISGQSISNNHNENRIL